MDFSLDFSHDLLSEYSSTESIATKSPTLDVDSAAEVHKSRLKLCGNPLIVLADDNKYANVILVTS